MAVNVAVDDRELRASLSGFVGSLSDKQRMLRMVGALMAKSIAMTFREQGSPAGSWPALAESTRRRRGYTAGHKLLVLSGILRGSVTNPGGYQVSGSTLTIGTNLVYARVQQEGSRDRMGAAYGPQAKLAGRAVKVGSHLRSRKFKGAGPKEKGERMGIHIAAHTRHQNIPPRPYLVFRPEDPQRIGSGIATYLAMRNAKLFAQAAGAEAV